MHGEEPFWRTLSEADCQKKSQFEKEAELGEPSESATHLTSWLEQDRKSDQLKVGARQKSIQLKVGVRQTSNRA